MIPEGGGSVLRVHVRPGATRPGLAGLHGDALALRVAARPVDGAANREVLAVIAAALEVTQSTVELISGSRGRDKRIRIHGLDPAAVARRLAPHLRV